MKKTLLLFMAVIGLLSSCSKEDIASGTDTMNQSQKARWYGLKTTNEPTTRGVADKSKLWNKETGIAIKFINNPADAGMIEKIKSIASEWETYAGIKFNYVESDKNASVRIAFDWQGNDWLTWSYTGTDAKYVRSQAEPTAVFGGLQYQDEEQFKGDVLRVFGQILGLEYEQRHQDWTFWRDEAKLKSYWTDLFDGMNMDWDEIRDYVFTPLSGNNAISPTQTPEIDELSVMAWPYYARTQTTKPLANYKLSDGDKAFIATLYPKDKNTLPTIQEAWVDAGFFEWVTKDNWEDYAWYATHIVDSEYVLPKWVEGIVALRMTALGAKQEYLPDVSDGEQLTSASCMFSHKDYHKSCALKKVPKFNTSNITNFSYMFFLCTNLEDVVFFDTSKGENFCNMFANCSKIKNIPFFNTSNGTNFSFMFSSAALKTIPLLDTSNGINFRSMFSGSSIESIPLLDTSNGTNFSYMFSFSNYLESIPLLDTSNGTNFNFMFLYATNLKTIPPINTSKGTNFSYMFRDCRSLTQKPNLDLSSATNTADMYYGTPFAN